MLKISRIIKEFRDNFGFRRHHRHVSKVCVTEGVDGVLDVFGYCRLRFAGEDERLPGDGFAEDHCEIFSAGVAELGGEECLLDVYPESQFLAAACRFVESL